MSNAKFRTALRGVYAALGFSIVACACARAEAPDAATTIAIPGTRYEFKPGRFDAKMQAPLLSALIGWIVAHSNLPHTQELPHIVRVSPERLAELLHRAPRLTDAAITANADDLLSVYRDDEKTIYLREEWTGKTQAELSILVHELVHHLQAMGRVKFNCGQEREKLAFDMQDRWLKLWERSLESEFGIDGFSLLAKTNCL